MRRLLLFHDLEIGRGQIGDRLIRGNIIVRLSPRRVVWRGHEIPIERYHACARGGDATLPTILASIPRRLFALAWPIIGLNVLSVLSLAVDTAMCGRLPNAEQALTALGFATQIVFLLLVAMMGVTVGTVALVARAHGANHPHRVNHILLQSTQLTVVVGVGVGLLGALFSPALMAALGASPEVTEAGVQYLRPLLAGSVFYYLNILYGAVFRGVGNTRLPFLVALVTNAVNVTLNYALILGNFGLPRLGVQGAALGTLISYAVGATILTLVIRRGQVPGLCVTLRIERFDRPLVRELFHIGLPAALDMVVLNASFLSIIGMLGHTEEVAVAAHGIGLRIQALAFVPGLSVSQATGAMVGHALGAASPREAVRVVRSSIVLCTTIMTGLAVTIVAGAYPIVQVFDVVAGSRLEVLSVLWMRLLGVGMPIVGVWIAFSGMLQGSGTTWVSLGINVLSTVVLQIPLSAILGFGFGLGPLGIWLAFPLSFIAKAALGWRVFREGRWLRLGLHVADPIGQS